MSELKSIDIEIAGKKFPVLLTEGEELVIHKLSLRINQEYEELTQKYGNQLLKTDILSMLLFPYAKKWADELIKQKQNQIPENNGKESSLTNEENS
jgi:cell division protein ZapA